MAKHKKSKNPFKLWGSWIGLGVYIILLFIPYVFNNGRCENVCQKIVLFPTGYFFNSASTFPYPNFAIAIPLLILNPIAYFFIGYIIHLLIRKKRKH